MNDAERFGYVFGSAIDQSAWDGAGSDERLDLLDEHFGPFSGSRRVLRLGVVEQLLSPDAPQVWATARRLARSGLDIGHVIVQLAMVLAQTAIEAIEGSEGQASDDETYQRLDRLPMPSLEEIEDVVLDIAGEEVVFGDRRAGLPDSPAPGMAG